MMKPRETPFAKLSPTPWSVLDRADPWTHVCLDCVPSVAEQFVGPVVGVSALCVICLVQKRGCVLVRRSVADVIRLVRA
jgi:hypothetical protein